MTQPGSQRDRNRIAFAHKIEADVERETYDRLHERLSVEQDMSAFLGNVQRVCRFLDTEPNPVYVDALLTVMMRRGHLLVLEMTNQEPGTYEWMVIRDVTKHTLRTEAKYRGILENNNPTPGMSEHHGQSADCF